MSFEAPTDRLNAKTGPKGITVGRLKASLRKHCGVYALAARDLGVDRSNVRRRVQRSPELMAFVAELEDQVLDVAEALILEAMVNRQDVATARWYLERKGKGRGYSRIESMVDEPIVPGPVTFQISYVGVPPASDDEFGGDHVVQY